jgi:ACS family allantoate permease-like MFS transporter
MQLPITGPNYNLLSAAFYIGKLSVLEILSELTVRSSGFLIWEFPTQYIAQRLRISKYLGEITRTVA